MSKVIYFILIVIGLTSISCGQNITSISSTKASADDLETIPLPTHLGDRSNWVLQKDLSDDFNYQFKPTNNLVNFGKNRWKNFYHSKWDGPGVTYWKYDHSYVNGSDLIIKSSRYNPKKESAPVGFKPNKMGMPEKGVNAGCITSTKTVQYPVYIDAKVSVTNLAMASDVWLLSSDATQEIDIIECYGGKEPDNQYFAKFIHVSLHSFIRKPFQDYQPRDRGAWLAKNGISSWGEYCDVNGDRKYVTMGTYWKSPFHIEFYVDSELRRVFYHNAVANKFNGTWQYGYPTKTGDKLDVEKGKQKIVVDSESDAFNITALKNANKKSTVSVIDGYNYQKGKGIHKPLNIIINVEAQDWHAKAGRIPTDADLKDKTKNNDMKVDWIRVFKPKH